MSVLHLITSLATGGAELSLLKLLEGSAELREGARVISLRDLGTVGPRLAALGIPVQAAGIRGSVPTPAAAFRLRRMVRAARPGILQGWMYHGNLAALAARRWLGGGVPLLWNIRHSVYALAAEKPMTAHLIRLGARLSRRVDRIIYNSRLAATQHEMLGYDPSRTVVIPNGFDTERFAPGAHHRTPIRAELGLAPDTPLIGLVGRYHPMKDHATFLQAVAQVRSSCPAVHAVMAGTDVTGDNPALQALMHSLGISDIVHAIGEVSDTARLTAALDLLCLSSSSEGFPNVVGEAMAAGVPCVVTDVGDTAWLVGDTGRVVPPRSPAALAAALGAELALSATERQQRGARARARILAEFTLPAIVRRYEALYDAVLTELPA